MNVDVYGYELYLYDKLSYFYIIIIIYMKNINIIVLGIRIRIATRIRLNIRIKYTTEQANHGPIGLDSVDSTVEIIMMHSSSCDVIIHDTA